MERIVSVSVGQSRFRAALLLTFGLLALFVSSIGLYCVMSHLVGPADNGSSASAWQSVLAGALCFGLSSFTTTTHGVSAESAVVFSRNAWFRMRWQASIGRISVCRLYASRGHGAGRNRPRTLVRIGWTVFKFVSRPLRSLQGKGLHAEEIVLVLILLSVTGYPQ